MPGTVLTVASGKGGVGKTTTAVNLAVALWTDGNAVAVVDADLGMANLAAVLGLEPEVTLHHVLAGRADLGEALIEAKDGDLMVLPGERDLSGFANADPGDLRAVLADLADRSDYVVVDTGAGLSYEDVLPLGLADEVVLVTTPDPAAVGDTRKTLELSALLDGRVRGVVVTKALEDTDAEAVAADVGVELLGVIPDDPAVTRSTTTGDPLASHDPDAPATAAYRDLAGVIAGGNGADEGAVETGEAPADDPGPPAEPSEDLEDGEAVDEDSSDDAPPEPEAVTADADEVAASTDPEAAADDEPGGPDEEPVETADEADAPAAPDDGGSRDEPPEDDPAAVDAPDGEGPHDGDGDSSDGDEESADDDEDAASGDGDAAGEDEPERRGGLTGWLGRLFS